MFNASCVIRDFIFVLITAKGVPQLNVGLLV